MSGYRVHLGVGFVLGVLFSYCLFTFFGVFDWRVLLGSFLVCLVYSDLPDLDAKTSKVYKVVNTILILVGIYFAFTDVLVSVLVFGLLLGLNFLGHRGWLHKGRSVFLFSLPLAWFGWWFVFAGMIGWFSHLVVDVVHGVVTKSKKRFRLRW